MKLRTSWKSATALIDRKQGKKPSPNKQWKTCSLSCPDNCYEVTVASCRQPKVAVCGDTFPVQMLERLSEGVSL